jgi:hypothetical protein
MLSRARSPVMADLPTADEQGLGTRYLFVERGLPAEGTPPEIVSSSCALGDGGQSAVRERDLGLYVVAPQGAAQPPRGLRQERDREMGGADPIERRHRRVENTGIEK